ncbi:MAG: hypothetical protein V3V78_00005 [Candidatus Woesearchaeota archaeon]
MPEEEYELMPHQTIVKLKHELEVLKKRAYSKEKPSKEVKASMDSLNNNINKLLTLFQEAAKSMGSEEPDKDPLMERVNEIEEENRKIAEGILVVADMINELKEGKKKIEQKLTPRPMPRASPLPKPVLRQMPTPRPMPKMGEKPLMTPPQGLPPRTAPRPIPPLMPTTAPRPIPPPRPMHPRMEMPEMKQAPRPMPLPPMPPPGMAAPSPLPPLPPPGMAASSQLPPLPDIRAGPPKKKGFFAKLFKKK